MKIAFDWGGVLSSFEPMRGLARRLKGHGWEIYCITAVPNNWTQEQINGRIKEVESIECGFTDIRVTLHDPVGSVDTSYKAGLEKARVMKELGCCIIFDDDPNVCAGVLDSGLLAIQCS